MEEPRVMIQAARDPSSIRALWILIGAVIGAIISGLVGWVASLYNHYRDSRKNHLEELKRHVLEPLRTATLAPSLSPAFEVAWGRHTYNVNVGVAGYPVTHGPVLQAVGPEISSDHIVESALLTDARRSHYKELIVSWEKFSQSVAKHSHHRREMVERLAKDILAFSGLPENPAKNNSPYVM